MNGAPTRTTGASRKSNAAAWTCAAISALDRLVRDDEPAGALHRRDDRIEVERHERPRVDHLRLDSVLGGKAVGRRERVVDECRERDDGDVATGAKGRGPADRHGRGRLGDVALAEVQPLVLDVDDRVRVRDSH